MEEKSTQEMSDETVAHEVQRGNADLFGVLVERYEQKMLRYGKRFLSRQEDIEDIVQDAFVNAYKNIQSFNTSLRFSPWMYRIAHNAFVNALRQNERRAVLIDFDTLLSYHVQDETAETERDLAELRSMLDRGLEKLPLKYREVLILHYFEDLPYKDISDVLKIPIGTVSIRIKRAKEELKKHIHERS
jgi:RNA polymerase sigma-70 factor (ECF subfamily)